MAKVVLHPLGTPLEKAIDPADARRNAAIGAEHGEIDRVHREVRDRGRRHDGLAILDTKHLEPLRIAHRRGLSQSAGMRR